MNIFRQFSIIATVISIGAIMAIPNNYSQIQANPAANKGGKGWVVEKRAKSIRFSVPRNYHLAYSVKTQSANWHGKDGRFVSHEFRSGDIVIRYVILENMKFKDLSRPVCGDRGFEDQVISSSKISKPMPGLFEERRLVGNRIMQFVLNGGADVYVFQVSWPSSKGQDVDKEVLTPKTARRILSSFRVVSARKDAGG